MGILGDQVLGSVALPNRLTDAVYHFLVNGLRVFLEHMPLHHHHQQQQQQQQHM
jgi:hypothetical protein